MISETTLTLEFSRYPCKIVPKPNSPGTSTVGLPEAAVSTNRLSPIASSPDSFKKLAISSWPTVVNSVSPSSLTQTSPDELIVMPIAFSGIVMPG